MKFIFSKQQKIYEQPVMFLASEQDFDPLSIIRCESPEFEARIIRIFLVRSEL